MGSKREGIGEGPGKGAGKGSLVSCLPGEIPFAQAWVWQQGQGQGSLGKISLLGSQAFLVNHCPVVVWPW